MIDIEDALGVRAKALDSGTSPKDSTWVCGLIYLSQDVSGEYEIDGHPVDLDTVGRYTGLKDRYGKKIYEGDIVEYNLIREYGSNYDPITLGFIGNDLDIDAVLTGKVMIWPSNGVMMSQVVVDEPEQFTKEHPAPTRWHVNRACKVIGNVYENPELLEANKNAG